MVWPWRAEEHPCRDCREAQQGDQCGPRRSEDEGATCRPWQHAAADAHPPTSGSLLPRKPRSGARWSGRPTSRRSDSVAGYSINPVRRIAAKTAVGTFLPCQPRRAMSVIGGRPAPFLWQAERAVIRGEEAAMSGVGRREFVWLLGGAAAVWPVAARRTAATTPHCRVQRLSGKSRLRSLT